MINYIPNIAKINKQERFNAIIKALEENDVPYTIEKVFDSRALGNIVVKFNKEKPDNILVSAHFDNINDTPGANDNAAACSILLNLIINAKDTDKNITFAFFDLEEYGFIGCREFLKHNKPTKAINLDMCGLGENIVYALFNYSPSNTLKLRKTAKTYEAIEVSDLPPGDAYELQDSNIQTVFVVNSTNRDLQFYKTFYRRDLSWRETYHYTDFGQTMHESTDTPDTINLNQVEKIYSFVKDYLGI